MLNKCFVWINDISYKDFSFEGVVEILSGNELNVYIDCSDDSNIQMLIEFIQNNINEHPSLFLESPKFTIVCWDCFIKCQLFRGITTETGECSSFHTFDDSMIRIGCNAWIDYPSEKFNRFTPFDKFILEQGSIDLRNLGKWYTVGNNGKYDIEINYEGVHFLISRFYIHSIQHTVSVEEDVPQFRFEFKNNIKFTLPELILLLASLRDFLSFITGRYIQLKDVTDYFQFERDLYRLILHVDFSAYYPSINEASCWGVNNVTMDELKRENISKLFQRWQSYYEKNSYPLAFFNRTNKDKLTPQQYITEVMIAFDSITDKRKDNKPSDEYKKLKTDIFQSFQSRFSELGLTEKDIFLYYSRPAELKERIKRAMSITGSHFYYDMQSFDDEEVAVMLKSIRNSSAHGIEIKPTRTIRPKHYYSLGNFCETLLIQYIRREILQLRSLAL